MKDFLVTVDGEYLYTGESEFARTVIDNALWWTPDVIDSVIDRILDFYDGIFDHNDFEYVFNNKTGRVTAFGPYFSVYSAESKKFTGYSNIRDFWKTAKPRANAGYGSTTANSKDLQYHRANSSPTPLIVKTGLITPAAGDRIFMLKREIVTNDNNEYYIKITKRHFVFPDKIAEPLRFERVKFSLSNPYIEGNISSSQTIIDNDFFQFMGAPAPEIINIDINYQYIKTYVGNVKAMGFLDLATGSRRDLTSFEVETVESVVFLFNAIYKITDFKIAISQPNLNLEFIFDAHFEIINGFALTDNSVSLNEYRSNFNLKYFQELRVRLLEFFQAMVLGGYWTIIGDERTHLATWIYGLFTPLTFKTIPYADKKKLFKDLFNSNLFITDRWNPWQSVNKLTEEQLFITIIESMDTYTSDNPVTNHNDINDFMDYLQSVPAHYPNVPDKSIFQGLYDNIDPSALFGDGGAQTRFVKAVYNLWLKSKYNPEYSGNPSVSPYFNQNSYTDFNALKYNENTEVVDILDETAAPKIVPYESEKKLLWYYDNFKFVFFNSQIIALKNRIRPSQFSQDEVFNLLRSKINSPFVRDFSLDNYVLPYGYYHMFQPVTLLKVEPKGTAVAIPLDRGVLDGNPNPCDIAAGRGGNLPLFYLKHIDDVGDGKDTEESIILAFDVITTIFGGWGLARRLIAEGVFVVIRSAFVRVALGESAAVVAAEFASSAPVRAALKSVIKSSAIPALELVLGTASIVHNLVEGGDCSDYTDCNNAPPTDPVLLVAYERCQSLQKWLFALEILTLSQMLYHSDFSKKQRES